MPAAAPPSASAPATVTAPDAAQPAPEPEVGIGDQQAAAAATATSPTVEGEEDDDEEEEVPSFMEDALGRRAELETAAALGSAEMSSSDLVGALSTQKDMTQHRRSWYALSAQEDMIQHCGSCLPVKQYLLYGSSPQKLWSAATASLGSRRFLTPAACCSWWPVGTESPR